MQLTNALKTVLLTLIFAVSVPALADVNVVTTIRPLEFIAKAVIGELGSTDSLIGRNASPHHFNFTPSNRRALNRADIVLWVGPEFEVHISENMERLVKGRPLLTAFDLADLKLLYLAESSGKDGHVWLSSHNAKVIASELAAQLAVIDPTNATAFAANLQQFKASLDVSNKAIQARLIAYKSTAYLVYHNGFQYFEQEQGLQHLLPLVLDPEVSPSINQIVAVRKKIEATQPKCLISEADANADLANTFTRGVEMKIVEVDLLGYNIPLSTQAYIELLESVADSYTACLSAAD
ncbi:MAG: zinc transport system substrate-binding protein [Pseudohongiellaceae bacterium]|jgi:zinc transport system substrate-binding protein